MRAMILALAACASGPRTTTPEPVVPPPVQPQPQSDPTPQVKREAQESIKLAILKLEGNVAVSVELGKQLCKRAHEDDAVQLAGCATKELIDEQLMAGCGALTPACLANIAKGMGATQILYGRIDGQGAEHKVTLQLVDAETQITKSWAGSVKGADDPKLEQVARDGYDALVGKVR
jgi:hypothetical protein